MHRSFCKKICRKCVCCKKRHKYAKGSDDENHSKKFISSIPMECVLVVDYKYNVLAKEAWDQLRVMVAMDDDEWELEMGTDLEKGFVYTRMFPNDRKVFKLQGLVEMGPFELFNEVIYNLDISPEWNPSVTECRTIMEIDENTDIFYGISAENWAGLIKTRDFVTLRRWGCENGVYMSAAQAVTHPDMPPQKQYIRLNKGVVGWVFKPVPEQRHQCYFEWYLITDLKGWLRQKLIDQTLSGILLQYLQCLRDHVLDLNNS